MCVCVCDILAEYHSMHSPYKQRRVQTEKMKSKKNKCSFSVQGREAGGGRRGAAQSVIISLSAVFCLHLSALLPLHQEQNAYTTMEAQGEEKGLWGEKLQGESWREMRRGGRRWRREEGECRCRGNEMKF